MKHLISSFVVIAAVVIFSAGCNVVDSEEPGLKPENAGSIPGAYDDPTGGAGMNVTDLSSSPSDIGDWQDGANESLNSADPNGWTEADPANRLGMPVIYFPYDSDMLVPTETAKLDNVATYYQDKDSLGLVIEGHCDERGTEEYNRSLGERRANIIRNYLSGKGLADSRIRTVSYGEDKPAVSGSDNNAWSQNRRGVLVPMYMK